MKHSSQSCLLKLRTPSGKITSDTGTIKRNITHLGVKKIPEENGKRVTESFGRMCR